MKAQNPLTDQQLGKLARFLDEHPGFSPLLSGEDAIVCGFQIGTCFLSLNDMEVLFDAPIGSHLPLLLAAPVEPYQDSTEEQLRGEAALLIEDNCRHNQ
jgi:hypothetical protein